MLNSPIARLDEVVSLATEKATTSKAPNRAYVGLEHLPSGGSTLLGFVDAEHSISTNNVFREGDVLFGKLRPRLRKSIRAPFDGYCSTDILVLRPTASVDPVFASFVLQSDAVFSEAIRTEEGTKMPRCSWSTLRNFPVYCPEPPAQQRIAEILTTVDEAIEQTEALIAKAQQIKAGLMHDLFTRGLTADGQLRPPREEAPQLYKESPLGLIPKEWDAPTIGECLSGIDAGKSPECPDTPAASDQWGVLKVGAVHPDGLRPHENKVVLNPAFRNAGYLLRDGDLLLSRANTVDLVGLVCQVREAPPNLMLSDKTLRLRANQEVIDPRYLYWALQIHTTRRQIENLATGTSGSMKNISQASVRALVAPGPEVKEQQRIAERLDVDSEARLSLQREVHTLRYLKYGLMSDLLMGRVTVALESEPEHKEVAANV